MPTFDSPPDRLDRLHRAVVERLWLQRFTALTRILLAIGFAPSGFTKAVGNPFTELPASDPVGAYFSLLHDTGLYYNFIGFGQLLACVLLLHPRTATLGAAIYLPIILNIAVLTLSVPFGLTAVITGLMLLACVYLLCWDYDIWQQVLLTRSGSRPVAAREYLVTPFLGALLSAAAFAALAALRVANLDRTGLLGYLAAAAAGGVVGLGCAWHVRQGVKSIPTSS